MEIKDIYDEIGEVVIHGQITFLETREIRNEKTIIIFHITDFTDTISCKVFVRNEQLPDILDGLKKGGFYRIKAVAMYDKFDHEISRICGRNQGDYRFQGKTSGHIHGKTCGITSPYSDER